MTEEKPEEVCVVFQGREFIFYGAFPDWPTRDSLSEQAWGIIDTLPYVRDLAPLATKIYLSCTFMQMGMKGIAYNAADEPIIALTYSWSFGKGDACPYDDPDRDKRLGL